MSVTAPTPVVYSTPSVLFVGSLSTIQSFDAKTGKLLGSTAASTSTLPEVSSIPVDKRANHGAQSHIVRFLIATEDGSTAVSLGEDKMLRVWQVDGWKLKSERKIIKKASSITFTADNKIILADRSGDVFAYPLEPPAENSAEAKPRPTIGELTADPSLNPDADLLTGHVSVVTSLVITQDNKRLITADRDEHIRVSRFPMSYVVDTFCLGHESFVAALHVPSTHPDLLISGGGDSSLFIWRWATGSLFFNLPLESSVFPHRCVKAEMRRDKTVRKDRVASDVAGSSIVKDEFATPPEGMMLPYGHGLCIGKIESMVVGDETAVVFYSEGCKSIHAFTLAKDLSATSASPAVTTLSFSSPVLNFTPLASHPGLVLVSLDLTWGILNDNGERGVVRGLETVDEAAVKSLQGRGFKVVQVTAEAKLIDVSANYQDLLQGLEVGSVSASVQSVRDYSLYTNLVLYPRWQGGEEDEFFAGEPNVDLDDKSKMGRRKLGRMKARGLVPTKEAPTSSNSGETRQPKANKKKKIDAAATESAPIEVDDEEAAMNQ